jgi:hypothetical protein
MKETPPADPTTHELRDAWQKAERRVSMFTPHSLLWVEARDEADTARRTYGQRLRTLSKKRDTLEALSGRRRNHASAPPGQCGVVFLARWPAKSA